MQRIGVSIAAIAMGCSGAAPDTKVARPDPVLAPEQAVTVKRLDPSQPLYDAVGAKPYVPVPVASEVSPCIPEDRFDRPANDGSEYSADLRGKTALEVLADRGEPSWCKSPKLWRYSYPRGCSDQRTIVSLWFIGNRVARTTEVRFHTGDHCM